jgi:hypothetical protein
VIITFPTLVLIQPGSLCASACFVAFLAGSTRMVGQDSKGVCVHGVLDSTTGKESSEATVALARSFARMGVHPQIVGRLAATPPDQNYCLNYQELELLGVMQP